MKKKIIVIIIIIIIMMLMKMINKSSNILMKRGIFFKACDGIILNKNKITSINYYESNKPKSSFFEKSPINPKIYGIDIVFGRFITGDVYKQSLMFDSPENRDLFIHAHFGISMKNS